MSADGIAKLVVDRFPANNVSEAMVQSVTNTAQSEFAWAHCFVHFDFIPFKVGSDIDKCQMVGKIPRPSASFISIVCCRDLSKSTNIYPPAIFLIECDSFQ